MLGEQVTQLRFAPPSNPFELLGQKPEVYVSKLPSGIKSDEYIAVVNQPLGPQSYQELLVATSPDEESARRAGLRGTYFDLILVDAMDDLSMARVKRHEIILGKDWTDFLPYRQVLMNTLSQGILEDRIAVLPYDHWEEDTADAIAGQFGDSCYRSQSKSPRFNSFVESIPYGTTRDTAKEAFFKMNSSNRGLLVVEFQNKIERFVLPDDNLPQTHIQTAYGVNLQHLGNQRIRLTIGEAYQAEADMVAISGLDGWTSYKYEMDPETVRNVNVLYPIIRWSRYKNGRTNFNLEPFDEDTANQVLAVLGFEVPKGLTFAPERLSPLVGASCLAYTQADIRGSWRETYSYMDVAPDQLKRYFKQHPHAKNRMMGNWEGLQQKMFPAQSILLPVIFRHQLLQSPLLPALEMHYRESFAN